MLKKKAAGSTMTLKDFHGGSIPSDLPLPSAPGVIPKVTMDRSVYDRAPWGASISRQDHRTRPSSSHSNRNFDDTSLFLPHTVHIGRNFNEDERKPLDGYSGRRRMVSDDVFRVANSRLEVKADSALAGRHSENSLSGTNLNVLNERKDVSVETTASWTTQQGVSNLGHGSGLEQSSGQWQSKLLVPSQIGFDVVKHSEIEGRSYKTNGSSRVQGDETRGTHVESGLVNGNLPGPPYLEAKEAKSIANSSNKPHPNNYSDDKAPEVVERRKLNLLPRTKPIESVVEKPLNNGKLENGSAKLIQRGTTQRCVHISKPGLCPAEIPNQPVVRTKLNLKPLTQRPEQLDVKPGKERSSVFGGARPRELVLKERGGIVETEHQEPEQPLETLVLKPVERPTSSSRDQRTRKFDQKDGRGVRETVRSETQSRNWRDYDNKSSRQKQQTQEKTRHPSPETWRKPESPERTGLRHGKAASALELAQAYSPISHPTPRTTGSSSYNTSRNRNNQTQQQQLFSRLVEPTTATTRQLNGY